MNTTEKNKSWLTQVQKIVKLKIVFFSCWNCFASATPLCQWPGSCSLENHLFERRKSMSCSKLYFLFVEILLLVLPHSVNELVVALSKITCLTKEKVCHAQNCIFYLLRPTPEYFASATPLSLLVGYSFDNHLFPQQNNFCSLYPTIVSFQCCTSWSAKQRKSCYFLLESSWSVPSNGSNSLMLQGTNGRQFGLLHEMVGKSKVAWNGR